MRNHCPKPVERHRRQGEAQLGQITLQVSLDKTAMPGERVLIRGREEGPWKAAAQPQLAPVADIDFPKVEPAQLNKLDAARERLRGLPEQVRQGAAQHEKPRGILGPIHQHAEHGKQIRTSLHLINHDPFNRIGQSIYLLDEAFRM